MDTKAHILELFRAIRAELDKPEPDWLQILKWGLEAQIWAQELGVALPLPPPMPSMVWQGGEPEPWEWN